MLGYCQVGEDEVPLIVVAARCGSSSNAGAVAAIRTHRQGNVIAGILPTVVGSVDVELYASWVCPTLVCAAFSPPSDTIRTET